MNSYKIDLKWDANNRFTSSVKPKNIASLPEEDQIPIIDVFCAEIAAHPWVAPKYDKDDLISDWRILQITDITNHYTDGGLRANVGGSIETPGKKIILNYQPHFWTTKSSGRTIAEAWNDVKLVRKAAIALLTTGTTITSERFIRELQFAGASKASMFNPSFAMAVIKKLAPDTKTWFDPFGGWGGRLMAARLLNIEYEAYELSENTYNGLKAINDLIGAKASLHHSDIDNIEFSKHYDLIFTSPPFFNGEQYEVDVKYNNYHSWLTKFLCKLVDKALSKCTVLLLHVNDKIKSDLGGLYEIEAYPISLRKSPRSDKGTEWIIAIKGSKSLNLSI